jgi:hypothetical protein
MSNLSKMAVQAALKLSGAGADLLVFGSRHGELVRTRKLLTAIADNEVLSPTAFSQSVHNTSAGLYSIIAGTHAPSSSLASGASTFASAWIEAEGFLAEYPAGKVLIVDCDDTLPVQYR